MAPVGNRLKPDVNASVSPKESSTPSTTTSTTAPKGSLAPSTTGVNESNTYAYSFAQSEKIRQIMARKEAKMNEEEQSEHLKNDLNKEILDEADEEEALGGSVTSEASPLSLLTGGSAVPLASMPYASIGSIAPGVSVGPLPTAIVNGQPIFSGNQGFTVSRPISALPMSSRVNSAAPIWPAGMKGSAVPSYR